MRTEPGTPRWSEIGWPPATGTINDDGDLVLSRSEHVRYREEMSRSLIVRVNGAGGLRERITSAAVAVAVREVDRRTLRLLGIGAALGSLVTALTLLLAALIVVVRVWAPQ